MWDAETIAAAPKEKVVGRARRAGEGECVLCGGPLSEGDWQVTLKKTADASRREPAHTHCAGDHGWSVL
jgi:hypothetical protein